MEFLGEAGEDGGGPKREFWCLLARDIKSLCDGDGYRCVPHHEAVGLQVGTTILTVWFDVCFLFLKVKEILLHWALMAMALTQGGSGFPLMAPPVYHYLCGTDMASILVAEEDVPNFEVRHLLKQVWILNKHFLS